MEVDDPEPRPPTVVQDAQSEHSTTAIGNFAPASNDLGPHEMRITDHGKIKNFVAFALKYLKVSGVAYFSSSQGAMA